ncbi:class I SAM-dependent methyltransferase [Pseudooceanicola aestuarii]|uniref:class I SAM-dependent methyltransferase n=1 Tax=Pseudooceanicola aestuarii TaxID=2697319 RepID=UPI0013D5FFDA|nr:class I SAM-dependent methyltransferase [Pseudooceanicola aestuarii]
MTRPPLSVITACRACGAPDPVTIHAFGDTPLADRLRDPARPETPDYRAPLTLCHCTACGLGQLRETVAPRILFGADYPYHSSVSPALQAHFHASARALMDRLPLAPGDLVMEAASNDGVMLAPFHAAGHRVLGIDPADGPVAHARARGIDTRHAFFTAALAREMAAEGLRARIFLANNVLAHVADVTDFTAGIAALLTPDGLAVLEVPWLLDLIDGGAFDTIYHQHLLYLSLTALVPLFARAGLVLNDAEPLAIHGGSLRLFVGRQPGQSPRLTALLAREAARDIRSPDLYAPLLDRMGQIAQDTRAALLRLKAQGARLAGYGAAAKATTLLHLLDLPPGTLRCIYDKSDWKQGLAMPGTDIPIRPASALHADDTPDALLLLAWNFAPEIIAQNAPYLARGGRILIPVPRLREITA